MRRKDGSDPDLQVGIRQSQYGDAGSTLISNGPPKQPLQLSRTHILQGLVAGRQVVGNSTS